jgi:hypothetical protein
MSKNKALNMCLARMELSKFEGTLIIHLAHSILLAFVVSFIQKCNKGAYIKRNTTENIKNTRSLLSFLP